MVASSTNTVVVDGARKTIAEVFAYDPAPSGFTDASTIDAVQNYQIAAVAFSPPFEAFSKFSSHRILDPSSLVNVSGYIYQLPYPRNFDLDLDGVPQPRYSDGEDNFIEPSLLYVEGNPRVTFNPLTVEALVGQDYAVVDYPLEDFNINNVQIFGESEARINARVIRTKGTDKDYYNFSTKRFQDLPTKKSFSFENGVVQFPLDLQTLNSQASKVSIERYEYTLQLELPTDNLYEKGKVVIDGVKASNVSLTIFPPVGRSKISNIVYNGDFSVYETLSGTETINPEEYGLATIPGWDQYNPLSKSTNPEDEVSGLGRVSLFKDWIGDNYVRLHASSTDLVNFNNGAAALETKFTIPSPTDSLLTQPSPAGGTNNSNSGPFNRYVEISFDCRLSTSSAEGLFVELQNLTDGTYYSFSDKDNGSAGWGSASTRHQISYSKGNAEPLISNNISLFANILGSKVNDVYKVTFIGGSDSGFADTDIKNIRIGYLTDVPFASDTFRFSKAESIENTLKTGDELLGASGIVLYDPTKTLKAPVALGEAPYTNTDITTYVTIPFTGMEPKKKYLLVIDSESTSSSDATYTGQHQIGVKLSHLDYCDILSQGDVNLLNQVGFVRNRNYGSPIRANTDVILSRYPEFGRYNNRFRLDSESQNGFEDKDAYSLMGLDISGYNLTEPSFVPVRPNTKVTVKLDSERIKGLTTSGVYRINLGLYNVNSKKKRFLDFKTNTFATELESSDGLVSYPGTLAGLDLQEAQNLDDRFTKKFATITSSLTESEEVEFSFNIPPRSDLGSDYILPDNTSLLFFNIIEQPDTVTESDLSRSRDSLVNKNLRLKNFEILGRYANAWHLTGPIGRDFDFVQKGLEYNFSGAFSGIPLDGSERYGIGERARSGLESTFIKDVTLGEKIAIPIYGLDNADISNNTAVLGSTSRESTYALTLISKGGPDAVIKSVKLVDASLPSYQGDTRLDNRSNITSEDSTVYSDDVMQKSIRNGWYIRYRGSGTEYPILKETIYEGTDKKYLTFSASNPASTKDFTLNYTGTLKDLGLRKGKEHLINIEGFQDPAGTTTPQYALGVYFDTDKSYRYLYSPVSGSYLPKKTFDRLDTSLFNLSSTTKDPEATLATDRFIVPEDITDDAVFTLSVTFTDYDILHLRKPRIFAIEPYADVSSLLSERPRPDDETIQPVYEEPGLFGQFRNKIQFSGVDKTDAFSVGAYPAAEGTLALSSDGETSSTYYGNMNRFSLLTENGYILANPFYVEGTTEYFDASSGFIVSATDPTTQAITVIAHLSPDEWDFINTHYGGFGAIGCFTVDREATAKKRGSDRNLATLPFISSSLNGQDANALPTAAPTRESMAATGTEFINAFCLKAQEETSDDPGTVRGIYTTFGSGITDFNDGGWSDVTSTTTYNLSFKYKVSDNPATAYQPTVSVHSHYFSATDLTADGNWNQFDVQFDVDGDNKGHDAIRWLFDPSGTIRSGENKLYLTDISLSSGGTEIFNTLFESDSDLLDFKVIDYSNQTKPLSLSRVFDGQKYTTSLYNENLLTEDEPIFRLFAKKTFYVGGLQKRAVSQKGVIVSWTINFI